jgi:hypothetical protein
MCSIHESQVGLCLVSTGRAPLCSRLLGREGRLIPKLVTLSGNLLFLLVCLGRWMTLLWPSLLGLGSSFVGGYEWESEEWALSG